MVNHQQHSLEPIRDSPPNTMMHTDDRDDRLETENDHVDRVYLGSGIGSIDSDSLEKLVSFHGYLTGGAFIGVQILMLGKHLLHVKEGERIHVVCETHNCIPDAFQILAGCTIGNKGLVIKDTGKLAATITVHTPPGELAHGVRIILDANKTREFERLHAWYMNTEKVPHEEVISELKKAGDGVYSCEYVEVPVQAKKKKRVSICRVCGEAFVEMDGDDGRCIECAENS